MPISLKPEISADSSAVEALFDRAFGTQRAEKISYRYRSGAGPIEALCRVALAEGTIVGCIRYWPIMLEPGRRPALLLGPLAVDNQRRAQGIGKALVDETLGLAADLGYRIVFLVGDPVYYRRFGFVPAPDHFIMPDEQPGRLMVRALEGFELERGGTLSSVENSADLSCHTG